MEYKIVEKEPFKLLAKVKAFKNEIISEENNTEIPDFWKQFGDEGVFDVLNKHTVKHDIMEYVLLSLKRALILTMV